MHKINEEIKAEVALPHIRYIIAHTHARERAHGNTFTLISLNPGRPKSIAMIK